MSGYVCKEPKFVLVTFCGRVRVTDVGLGFKTNANGGRGGKKCVMRSCCRYCLHMKTKIAKTKHISMLLCKKHAQNGTETAYSENTQRH